MPIKVVGLGAGGHGKVVLEILRDMDAIDVVGLLDPDTSIIGSEILGVPVLGNDELLPTLKKDNVDYFFIGVGSVADPAPRRRLFDLGRQYGMIPIDAIHRESYISPSATYQEGTTIMPGTIINSCAQLGANVIVNTGAIVEHDCMIGDHVHISTGARLSGGVHVADNVHIGVGATVLQQIRIGENVVVGAGAVVLKDVPAGATVVGCPAKKKDE